MRQSLLPTLLIFAASGIGVVEWRVLLGDRVVQIGLEDGGGGLVRSIVGVPFRAEGGNLVSDFLLIGDC